MTVVVSKGAEEDEEVSIPNVQGYSQEEATSILENRGLVVTTTTATSNRVAIGEVIDQSPEAGTNVAPGTTVTLVINTEQASADPTTAPEEGATNATWELQQIPE